MSKKKCGHIGRISRLLKTGTITCHKMKCTVEIIVFPEDGGFCTNKKCPYSRNYVPPVEP